VLIGGWVPYFLLENIKYPGDYDQHVGSLDIDVPWTLFHSRADTRLFLRFLRERILSKKDALGRDIPASFLKKVALKMGKK
jgi:hypothetical protein